MIMQTVKTTTSSDTETTSSTKLHPLSNRIVKWYMNLPVDAKLAVVLFQEMLRAEQQMPDRYLADDVRSKLSNQMKDETVSEDRGEVALMHGLFLMMQGWDT
jgi:hypothetical protein